MEQDEVVICLRNSSGPSETDLEAASQGLKCLPVFKQVFE